MSNFRNVFTVAILFLFTISLSSQSIEENGNNDLHELFDEIRTFERAQGRWGNLYRGEHPQSIGFLTSEEYKKQLKDYNNFSQRLSSFENIELSAQDRISLETMDLKLSGAIGQLKYQNYLIPFNAEGGFFNRISSALGRLPFSTTSDLKAYQKWLPSYANFLQGHQSLMAEGIDKGVVAPKVIVRNLISQMKPWIKSDADHPMIKVLNNVPPELKTQEWELEKESVKTIMSEQVLPVYQELYRFAQNEYLQAAYKEPGIANIPNGRAYYEDRVAFYTTLSISPEEVYQTGLLEVQRIKNSMESIIQELQFEGSFEDFLSFLRTDEQFYAKTPQELLSYASWLSKKAEGQLPKLFSHLYELPFTVEPVPDDIAPTYTGGRYVQGNREQDRPGIYWVNTYNLPARSLYNIPALTVHEAVPGHHLQIMLAAELDNLPAFRNNFYISAFGEGWGLYSEYLGEEMGMYATPYDRFGRFTYEMWRACRLVVDVGLHYKNWTREQAVEYLAGNTALSLHEVNTEIDRYIGWPGQALSYKMGEITIKELRQKASDMLGDRFDIKEFHYHVLKNGSIPLPTLIREIDGWIESKE